MPLNRCSDSDTQRSSCLDCGKGNKCVSGITGGGAGHDLPAWPCLCTRICRSTIAGVVLAAHRQKRGVVDCPKCGLTNPETASRCDCGYDFATGRMRPAEVPHQRGRGKDVCGAASLIIGLSSVSLFFVLQQPRFRTFDFGVAITVTKAALLFLLAGVVLGSIARGILRWLGVVSCAVGLLFWLLMAIGALM